MEEVPEQMAQERHNSMSADQTPPRLWGGLGSGSESCRGRRACSWSEDSVHFVMSSSSSGSSMHSRNCASGTLLLLGDLPLSESQSATDLRLPVPYPDPEPNPGNPEPEALCVPPHHSWDFLEEVQKDMQY